MEYADVEALATGQGTAAFEKKWGLMQGAGSDPDDPTASPDFYAPYLASLRDDPSRAIWYLPWQIIHGRDNVIIGGLLFKGGPDGQGQVEVGYGLEGAYQNRGYMTQALSGLLQWALGQRDVLAVIAETDRDNLPSLRVLQSNAMRVLRTTPNEIWYTTLPE